MTTMPALTTHQRKVLDYMLAFFEANDMLPPNAKVSGGGALPPSA